MTRRTRLITTLAALSVVGCAPPAQAPGVSTTAQRTLLESGSDPDSTGPEVRAYCYGQARDAFGDVWAFSMSTGQESGRSPSGFFLLASSVRNLTLFGRITGGTLTHAATGGGTAQITGTLTTGQPITLLVSDLNSATAPDTLQFTAGNGPGFSGDYVFGGVRILRARPKSQGALPAPGYRFDPAIGLFMVQGDLDNEQRPPDQLVDVRAVEVVRPDPEIDFRANDPGGYTEPPGSDNNTPPPGGG